MKVGEGSSRNREQHVENPRGKGEPGESEMLGR